MRLCDLKIGESGRVLNLSCEGITRRRLLDLGFTPNTVVTVKKVAPFNDPMHITLRNYSVSIRKSESFQILVEKIER